MSKCESCNKEMDKFEAQEWENCFFCRRDGKGRQRIRTLYGSGNPPPPLVDFDVYKILDSEDE